jgi:hypothetical protein
VQVVEVVVEVVEPVLKGQHASLLDDVCIGDREPVAVPALLELLVIAPGIERVGGKVQVELLPLAVQVGRSRPGLDDGIPLARAPELDVGIAHDRVDVYRAILLARAARVRVVLNGDDRCVPFRQRLSRRSGGGRRRSRERGPDQTDRDEPRSHRSWRDSMHRRQC